MDRCWWSRCQANDGLGATNARVAGSVAMRVRRRFRAATEDMWKGGGGAATRRDGVDDVRVPCLALRAACITLSWCLHVIARGECEPPSRGKRAKESVFTGA